MNLETLKMVDFWPIFGPKKRAKNAYFCSPGKIFSKFPAEKQVSAIYIYIYMYVCIYSREWRKSKRKMRKERKTENSKRMRTCVSAHSRSAKLCNCNEHSTEGQQEWQTPIHLVISAAHVEPETKPRTSTPLAFCDTTSTLQQQLQGIAAEMQHEAPPPERGNICRTYSPKNVWKEPSPLQQQAGWCLTRAKIKWPGVKFAFWRGGLGIGVGAKGKFI